MGFWYIISDQIFDSVIAAANQRLSAESTRFKHPNGLVPLASADCTPISTLPD